MPWTSSAESLRCREPDGGTTCRRALGLAPRAVAAHPIAAPTLVGAWVVPAGACGRRGTSEIGSREG